MHRRRLTALLTTALLGAGALVAAPFASAATSHSPHPLDISQAGHYLFVANVQSAGIKIAEYDTSTGAYLRTLPLSILGAYPNVPMLATPTKFFIANDLGNLAEYDNATGNLVRTYQPPKALASINDFFGGNLFSDGSTLYAVTWHFGDVVEISLSSGAVLGTTSTAWFGELGAAHAGVIFTSDPAATQITATSATTGRHLWTTRWAPTGSNSLFGVTSLLVVKEGLLATAASTSGAPARVALINPATGAIERQISYTGKGLVGPADSAYVNGQVFIYNQILYQSASSVTQIDPTTMSVVRTIATPANANPTRFTLAGTSALFVTNPSSVTEYETSTGKLLATFN